MRTPASLSTRPASAPRNRQIIDLTEDTHSSQRTASDSQRRAIPPPPPAARRATHEVIDLSDSSDETQTQFSPPSPEIQFIRSRARSRSVGVGQRPPQRAHVPQLNPNPSRAWFQDQWQYMQGGVGNLRDQFQHLPFPSVLTDILTFRTPESLNFEAPGFDLDFPHRQPPPPPPTYAAPTAPRAGFTRSNVTPGSLMVCPMCDDELGVGDSEQKKQVWVARLCGHVGQNSSKPFTDTDFPSGLLRRVCFSKT